MTKPCEYCGGDLPLGVDKKTRQQRSHHFATCKARPVCGVEPLAPAGDPFLQGVCVALQALTAHGDGVLWREIVETAGVDDILQYAAHIEPEEWELAGFSVFAKSEMGRNKPKAKQQKQTSRSKNEDRS